MWATMFEELKVIDFPSQVTKQFEKLEQVKFHNMSFDVSKVITYLYILASVVLFITYYEYNYAQYRGNKALDINVDITASSNRQPVVTAGGISVRRETAVNFRDLRSWHI